MKWLIFSCCNQRYTSRVCVRLYCVSLPHRTLLVWNNASRHRSDQSDAEALKERVCSALVLRPLTTVSGWIVCAAVVKEFVLYVCRATLNLSGCLWTQWEDIQTITDMEPKTNTSWWKKRLHCVNDASRCEWAAHTSNETIQDLITAAFKPVKAEAFDSIMIVELVGKRRKLSKLNGRTCCQEQ